jgi:PAS domain S-box-containing protein
MSLQEIADSLNADAWSQTVLETIRQGVWVIDAHGVTRFANQRMAEMLCCSRDELMHRSAFDFVYPEDQSAGSAEFDQRKTSPAERKLQFRYRRADGTPLWTFVETTPICDESGTPTHFIGMFTDITAEKQAADELKKKNEIMSRLIDSNIVGIVEADAERIYSANDRFLQMVGRNRETLLDGAILRRDLTPPEFWTRDEQAIAELRSLGVFTPYEKAYLRPDGTRVPVYLAGAAMSGDPMHWVCFVIDLTPLKRAEADASAARDAAEQANRAKDRFIAILSHELRTPLNPVSLLLSSLSKDPSIAPPLRSDLEMMRRNVELEFRLIDDLLDMTRVLNGKLSLLRTRCDLHAILREAAALVDADVKERQLALKWNLAATQHEIDADPTRISQVVWNLIRNATKFTPAGGEILIQSSSVNGRICVQVRDTGQGIQPEQLERIFLPFSQADDSHPRHGGLGLGLAISKTIIDLHGGEIRAVSDGKDQGACFTFELDCLG